MAKIIHSKCEADGSFAPDERGNTWTKTGSPSYTSACKFNNGALVSASAYHDLTFVAGAAFSLSFWAKMGAYANGDFYFSASTNNRIGLNIYNKNAYTYIPGLYSQALHSSFPAWSDGDNVHIGISCDWGRSAGDRVRLYVNNSILSVGASYGETDWTGATLGIQTKGTAFGSMDDVIIFDSYITDYSPYINFEGGVTPSIINC